MIKTLRANYTKPLSVEDGNALVNNSWGELLYHLNRLMQRGALMENYAIRRLQEQIVTQVKIRRLHVITKVMLIYLLFFFRVYTTL